MATNKVYELGIALQFNVGTGVKSNDPVVVGSVPGVALADADATGYAPVDLIGVYNLSVKGIDHAGNAAMNSGDPVYYVDGNTPKLGGDSTDGTLFGYAYSPTIAAGSAVVASGATATIPVILARV